jgi:hypothetical protein
MSANRRRRLERLESRQPKGRPWFDPWDAIMRLWPDLEAVAKGRACWRKREPAEPWSEETQVAFELAVREYDRIHDRLMAERKAAARRSAPGTLRVATLPLEPGSTPALSLTEC